MPLRCLHPVHSTHPHPHYTTIYTGLLTKKAAHVFFEIAATARLRIRLVCQSESNIISLSPSQNSLPDDVIVRKIEGENRRSLFLSTLSRDSLCSADYIGHNSHTFDKHDFDSDNRENPHYCDNDNDNGNGNDYDEIDITCSQLNTNKPSRLQSARDAIADFFLPSYSSETEMAYVPSHQLKGHKQSVSESETFNALHSSPDDFIESKV
jgi:hypothetical protein